ncbi:hypothetical protein PSY31_23545, partial [Shigella flexneri]|nr:hypothetical protein [Shigella flexneri]
HEEPFIQKTWNFAEDSTKISTYTNFIEHLDQQLKEIEEELETFLKFPSILLENKEKLDSTKVQHATEVLESIRHSRQR